MWRKLSFHRSRSCKSFSESCGRLSKYEIADKCYTDDWGPYDPKDSTRSSWKVREANRYLTELDRSRELQTVTFGVWVGVLAAGVAILAMPVKDSVLALTIGEQGALWVTGVLVAALALGAFKFLYTEIRRARN
jgi:hypothetical protein